MSTIKYKSELTTNRIMHKHSKGDMAYQLFQLYSLLNDIADLNVPDEVKKRIRDKQTIIAWGS